MTSENAALAVVAVRRDFCGLNLCLQLRGDCVEGIKRANKQAALSCFCFCYVIDSVHILLFAIAQVMNCYAPCFCRNLRTSSHNVSVDSNRILPEFVNKTNY